MMKSLKITISLIAFIILGNFLKEISRIAVPAMFGVIFGFVFSAIVLWFKKKKVPVALTIPITLIIFLLASTMLVLLITSATSEISDGFSWYRQRGASIIQSLTASVPFIQADTLVRIQNSLFSVASNTLLSLSVGLVQFASSFIITLFFFIFILIEEAYFDKKLVVMYKNKQKGYKISSAISNINIEISRFMSLKFLISVTTATVVFIGFSFVGMDFLIMWFLLTLLLNFIPSVGSVLVSIISIAFAFIKFYPSPGPIITVSIIMIGTQMIIGNVLDPLLLGDRLNLSPLIIFIFLLYWGWVWGIGGMLLSVPIAVAVRVICAEFSEVSDTCYYISKLMGNKRDISKEYNSINMSGEKN